MSRFIDTVPGVLPHGPVKVNLEHPLARDMCFCWLPGPVFRDYISGRIQDRRAGATNKATKEGIGWNFPGTSSATNEFDAFQPVVTSAGDGTGDFTVMASGISAAAADVRCMFSARASGTPNSSFFLALNSSATLTTSSGSAAFITYRSGYSGISTTGQVDGKSHIYAGTRLGDLMTLYRDGVSQTSDSPVTKRDILVGTQDIAVGDIGGFGSTTYAMTGEMHFAYAWNRALDASEIALLARDFVQWGEFIIPDRVKLRIVPPPAAGGITVTPDAGSLTLTGNAPTVVLTNNITIDVPAGSLAITGYAPVVMVAADSVTPGVGSLTLTGYAPTLTLSINHIRAPPAGSLSLTGYAPNLAIGDLGTVNPDTGALTLTGYAPTLAQTTNNLVLPGTGALTLTGYAPSTTGTESVQPGAGSLSLTGYAPTVELSAGVSPGVGSLALTGYAPTLVLSTDHVVQPSSGILSITGYAPKAVVPATWEVQADDSTLWTVQTDSTDTWNIE